MTDTRKDDKDSDFSESGCHHAGWTFQTLYTHLKGLMEGGQKNLLGLIVAADDRYTERFQSQTKAVDAALIAQEKAVATALIAQEKAVVAALQASDKAVTKAEATAEKWRENANEWRGAMHDRDRLLMPRQEVENQYRNLDVRLNDLATSFGLRLEDVKTQFEKSLSHKEGVQSQTHASQATVGIYVAIASAIGALVIAVVALLAFLKS